MCRVLQLHTCSTTIQEKNQTRLKQTQTITTSGWKKSAGDCRSDWRKVRKLFFLCFKFLPSWQIFRCYKDTLSFYLRLEKNVVSRIDFPCWHFLLIPDSRPNLFPLKYVTHEKYPHLLPVSWKKNRYTVIPNTYFLLELETHFLCICIHVLLSLKWKERLIRKCSDSSTASLGKKCMTDWPANEPSEDGHEGS